jgi:hypothetical protein
MTQVVFSGATGTIANLNQNFTQLYDLREYISTPGYTASTPKLTLSGTTWTIDTAALGLTLKTSVARGSGTNWIQFKDPTGDKGYVGYGGVDDTLSMVNSLNAGVTVVTNNIIRLTIAAGGAFTLAAPSSGAHSVSGGLLEIGTGGVGYATGAGGTVAQATSKSTGVTLNKSTGTITMNAAALNATTSVSFVLTNSLIAATDVVNVAIKSGATLASYFVQVDATAAGSCTITVRNYTAGNLSEAIVLSFAVLKGVAA